VKLEDFRRRFGGRQLKENARRNFIEAFERRMETLVTHPRFDSD
jgi:CRISPR/Cas system-associated endonuclease Cas1